MTLKMKLTASISAFLLVLGLMLTGIFAVNKTTVNMGGSINFTATDVYARVKGSIEHDTSKPANLDVTYSAEGTEGDDTVWNDLKLAFDDQATPIVVTITVENLSPQNTLRVNLNDTITSTVENFNKAVEVGGQPYTNLKDITLQPNGQADDSTTFLITFSIEDRNNSITAEFNYDINLFDQYYVEPVELTGFEFDGYGTLVSYTGTDTDVSIPSSYSMIGQPTQQTLYIESREDYYIKAMNLLKMTHFNYVYNGESSYYEYCDAFVSNINSNTINFPCEIEYDDYSEVTFTSGNDIKVTAIQGAFAMNTTIETVSIPLGVSSIGYSTFYECSKLTSMIIPDSVTSIGGYAFNSCSALTSVTIGNSVTSIGWSAFAKCSRLESVDLSNCTKLTSIGKYAFQYCDSLISVAIGDNVISIGDYAFLNCSGLKSVTIRAMIPPRLESMVFEDLKLKSIYVPSTSVDAYKSAEGWIRYSSKIKANPQS